MKILVANNAGACYGVNRSLDIVEKASSDEKNIATLGELIHNPKVVLDLKSKYGIDSVSSVEDAKSNDIDTLIVRSHGIAVDVYKQAEQANIELIDATCPYVKNVQTTASVLAGLYPAVIIVGREGHPEVESVSSFILEQGSKCFVVQTKEQIDKYIDEILALNDSIGIVSQTTQSAEVFDDMVDYLKSKGVKLEIENTICAATKKRQSAACDLSKKVDVMIVLGGKNSSNTNHLADLCSKNCDKVYHIESAEELDLSLLDGIGVLGITAGASTPKSQIDSLLSYLS